jgi:YVTN family beta-propeller protein
MKLHKRLLMITISAWLLGSAFVSLPAEAESFAYVANSGPSNVLVINTATNTVVATVPVGLGPSGVAITPNGAFAYVANFNSDDVSVINTATNTVVATVTGLNEPTGVAINPNGAFAYVTSTGQNGGAGAGAPNVVSVINTATNTVVATVPVGLGPIGVAITPNGAFAYVTNRDSNDVSVINTATNTVVATVPVGFGPDGVAITPNGAFAYVANVNSADVSVINTATNTVVATVPVGVGPRALAVANIPFNCREDDGEDVEGDGHEQGDHGHHKRKPPCKHTGEDGFDRR